MVDSTTLIVLTSVAQTVVISLTLGVFIFQFRSQEKAIKDAAYQALQGRYTDFVRMLVEKPELAQLLRISQERRVKDGDEVRKLSQEEMTLSAYILLGYGIFEEVYLLYKKKWIDKDTWDQWVAFLRIYSDEPLFRQIHEGVEGTFDRDFYKFVTQMINEKEQKPAPTG